MRNSLIHPKLMDNLYRFFPDIGNVERGTLVPNEVGDTAEELTEFEVLHEDVKCRISAWSGERKGDEYRRPDKTVVLHPYQIVLKGVYDCKESDRFVHLDKTYDILSVDYDSENNYTRLITEIISI